MSIFSNINKSPIDLFIENELIMSNEEKHFTRLFSYQFNLFIQYCKENRFKDTSTKYFSAQLKKKGFNTYKFGKKKLTYINGETKNIYKEELEDDDADI